MTVSKTDSSSESPSEAATPVGSSTGLGLKRQFVWSMLPLLVISVLNVFSVRFFYKFLGVEMYAVWFDVNVLSGSFGFIDLGIGTAVARYVGVALGAKDKVAVRQYWATGNLMAIPVLLAMSAVFIGVGVIFGPRWYPVNPDHVRLLQWAFVAGGCSLFLNYYTTFWLLLSQAHLDFKFIGTLRSIVNIIQVCASVWLAAVTGNPVVLIGVGIACNILTLAVYMWHARKHYQLGMNLGDATMARAREMMALSSKVFGTVLVNAFGGSADRLILGKFAPQETFAFYNTSYMFGQRMLAMGGSISGPVFSQTSRALGKGTRSVAAGIYNETFDFTFGFYALMAIWAALWHPVFLRTWLGNALGPQVGPAFTPMVIAFCLSGISSIATAQLAPLNRVGIGLGFGIANSVGLAAGAVAGWFWGGLAGVGWGVLASRITTIAQDIYVIRAIGGGGWLSSHTWNHLLLQVLFGLALYLSVIMLPTASYWKLIPAAVHGCAVVGWLMRHYVRRFLLAR